MKTMQQQPTSLPSIFKTAPKNVGVNVAPAKPAAPVMPPSFTGPSLPQVPVAAVGFNEAAPPDWQATPPPEASVPGSPTGKYPAPMAENVPNPAMIQANIIAKQHGGKAV